MKEHFASKHFASKHFASGHWAGVGVEIVVIHVPGLEWKVDASRLQWTLDTGRLHWKTTNQ